MSNVRKRSRAKLYGIAIPIFLVLSLILGSLAYIGGENYRQSFYVAGLVDGANYAYPLGWEEGVEAGYAAGQIDGFLAGYKTGVFALGDKYHVAALQLEEWFPWMDVSALFSDGEIMTISLIMPFNISAATDADAMVMVMLDVIEDLWDGEEAIRIVLSAYHPQYEAHMTYYAFEFPADSLFEHRLGPETQARSLIASIIYMPGFLMMWPSNPYYEPSN